MKSEIDGNGWPIVPHPANSDTIASQVKRFLLIQFVFSLIVPSFVASSIFKGKVKLSELGTIYKAVSGAHRNPIKQLPEYQDKELIRQLWGKDSARPYIEGDALEYQTREGYCSSATIRCTLKSFPSYPREKIPPQKSEASDPEKWQGMDAWGEANEDGGGSKNSANLEIVPGSCSYDEFLSAVKRGLEDPRCRIVLNYLRPVLFGFAVPWWLPANMCIGLMGGHFSPIVGMIETEKYKGDNPLIGVFDVNHKYGGAYLVPAKTLFLSVQLMDVSSQKPRAMILIHEPNSKVKGVR